MGQHTKNIRHPKWRDVTMRPQKGTALITALLITAIVAAIATVMAVRQSISIRETELSINANRTTNFAQGVFDWAKVTLITDLQQQNDNKKKQFEIFPKTLKNPKQFYGADISGTIQDGLARFNVNALINTNNRAQFARLIQIVDPDINKNTALNITQNVSQWLRPSNADEIYMREKPPYRASHMLMVSTSELRLVVGVNAKLYEALQPYIAVLPNSSNKINITDAPGPVIMSLGKNISRDQAKTVVSCQQAARTADNPRALLQSCILKNKITIDPTVNIVYTSNFFLVRAFVKLANQDLQMISLLERDKKTINHKTIISIKTLSLSRE